ncbi:MAG: DUF4166 domain-containing protein [Pseudomonadota bacterium]
MVIARDIAVIERRKRLVHSADNPGDTVIRPDAADGHCNYRFDPRQGDDRFRKLLGDKEWDGLPAAIQKRFGKRFGPGQSVAYQGVVTRMWFSRAGRILAHLVRLVGGPLPYDTKSTGQPAVVCVTEDTESHGQFWIRQYGRRRGFPQVVHSSKRFDGPTGLEEYVGYGIGMALKLEVGSDTLYFKNDHYFLKLLGMRLRLPRFLSPGELTIGHHELGRGYFAFSLLLEHPWLGRLIDQEAIFVDPVETVHVAI